MFVYHERRNQTSTYKHYLKFLPDDFSSHPMFYSDEEVELLKGSSIMIRLTLLYEKYLDEIEEIEVKLELTQKSAYGPIDVDNYLKSRHLLFSRAFNISRTAMVPYADLFNHYPLKENIIWDYDDNLKAFVIKTTRDIKAGEEVM